MKDFTLEKYRDLLSAISTLQIPVYGIADWIRTQPRQGLLLRHDIDRQPANAIALAQTEKEFGVRATYYFRCSPKGFAVAVIRQIAACGHEIGYHYEDLSTAKGDLTRALDLFKKHLDELRAVVPVQTVSMHGSPASPYDNRDLLQGIDFGHFNIAGDALLSIDYSRCYYFTDTGRQWRATPLNFRDRPETCLTAPVSSTDELIKFIAAHKDQPLALAVHPERWPSSLGGYVLSCLSDFAVSWAKRFLLLTRGTLS